MDPPKQFSKIQVFQTVGLLSRKFNPETSEFESTLSLRLLFWISMISREYFSIKMWMSCFFPQKSSTQLYVGSIFNYLPDGPKRFMGIAAFFGMLWGFSFNYVFTWLNTRSDYKLFRVWMRMTFEIPPKNERDYRVAGLSGRRNKQFWQTENRLNRLWYRLFNYYVLFISILFSSQLFFVRFDEMEIVSATYILWQTFHVLQTFHAFYAYNHCFYTLNFFHATSMQFFSKRFQYIGKQVKRLSTSGQVNNRKLAKLIVENNRVHHDLIFINDFFRSYCGFNMLSFYAIGVTAIFLCLIGIGLIFIIGICSIIGILYLSVMYFPCIVAKMVRNEIKRTKRRFENIAFHRSVSIKNRQKIESISELSEKAGFTVFTWFHLDNYTGLLISFEFVVYLLLLIQTYFYYTKF